MRTIVITIIAFFVFGGSFLFGSSAQQNVPAGALQITPPIVDIAPGETYDLVINNQSDTSRMITVQPAFFTLDAKTKSVLPVETDESPIEFLNVNRERIEIEANTATSVEVTYLQEHSSNIVGILVAEGATSEDGPIPINAALASIIYDFSIENPENIMNELDVKPVLGLATTNFGREIDVTSRLINNSEGIIVPKSGEVSIEKDTISLKTFSLTQRFNQSLWKEESFENKRTFIDERDWWDRFGFITFRQAIIINNKEFVAEKRVLNIPWEIVTIGIGLIAVGYVGYVGYRRYASSAHGRTAMEKVASQ